MPASAPPTAALSSNSAAASLHGIAFMVAGIALLSLMDAIAKSLVMQGIPAIQIIALRSVIIVPVMLAGFAVCGQFRELKPTRPVAHAVRGLTGIVAPLSFFIGVGYMPLTSAVVVFFSSIFMVTLLSIVFLKERVGKHRWAAIVTGYIGVFIAMAPGGGGSLTGYLLVLLASCSYAFLFISGRYLSRTESISSLVLSFNLGVGLVACASLPWFWQAMNSSQLAWILLLSAFALSGHFCLTKSFSLAEASVVAPFEYTAVIWALLLDLVIWQSVPGAPTWAGAVIIIASGLYVIYREQRRVQHE